ncbi:hypothetical protein [Halobacterium sp. CBA1126]|uniref:hypothetical protein n=1 Tax=Halobacterium sp. CBA1126 TaxID=2668074 RepID=UPI0012F7236F|nr:hypothetical protein [Halobacterium sp. CBA1126]MUV59797.1 hypothetical protein [Halobacterium sp. CBA1126]
MRLFLQIFGIEFAVEIRTTSVSDVVKPLSVLRKKIRVEKGSATVADVVAGVIEVLRQDSRGEGETGFLEGFEDTVVCLGHPVNPRSSHTGSSNAATKIALVGVMDN